MASEIAEAFLLEEMGYCQTEGPDPTYIPFDNPEREAADHRRIQLESGLNFDDLKLMWEAGSMPAYGTPQLRGMVEDAISTTVALAETIDPEMGAILSKVEDPKTVRLVWERLNHKDDHDGQSDWRRTVFETLRVREHLYEDEWSESLFRVQMGDFSYFAGLNDPWVMKAVQWLEGDDTMVNLAKPKQRHRNDGGWLVQLDGGKKFAGIDREGRPRYIDVEVKVWVQPGAFVEHAFQHNDSVVEDGSFSRIELKRGRKPKGRPLPNDGFLIKMKGRDVGLLTPLGYFSWLKDRQQEARWIEPEAIEIRKVIDREWLDHLWSDCLAQAEEDETVVVVGEEPIDEVFDRI